MNENYEILRNGIKFYSLSEELPPLEKRNKITDYLDKCYLEAKEKGFDLVHDEYYGVKGLPGSGKTGIILDWAKERKLDVLRINYSNYRKYSYDNDAVTPSELVYTEFKEAYNKGPFVLLFDQIHPEDVEFAYNIFGNLQILINNDGLETSRVYFTIVCMTE